MRNRLGIGAQGAERRPGAPNVEPRVGAQGAERRPGAPHVDLRAVAMAAMATLASGCGGGKDTTELQLAALRAELVKMRVDNAVLAERLSALEVAQGGRGARLRSAQAAAEQTAPEPAPDRPTLEVIRLAPGSDGARPVLRSVAGNVVVEDDPTRSPPSVSPSTPSRRKP